MSSRSRIKDLPRKALTHVTEHLSLHDQGLNVQTLRGIAKIPLTSRALRTNLRESAAIRQLRDKINRTVLLARTTARDFLTIFRKATNSSAIPSAPLSVGRWKYVKGHFRWDAPRGPFLGHMIFIRHMKKASAEQTLASAISPQNSYYRLFSQEFKGFLHLLYDIVRKRQA